MAIIKDYTYDVEIYPNLFEVTFIPIAAPQQYVDTYINIDKILLEHKHKHNLSDKKVQELQNDKKELLKAIRAQQFIIYKDPSKNHNDIYEGDLLIDFFTNHKNLWGYNSNNYDKWMLDIFIYNHKFLDSKGYHKKEGKHITQYMFEHSCNCINFGKGYGKLLGFNKYYKRPFRDYDIQKITYLDKSFTALKQVAICLKWYRIQDLPIVYDAIIKENEVFPICDYNVNDTLITRELIINQKSEIDLRKDLTEEFGIDMGNLSRSSIGKSIATKLYSQFSGKDPKDFVDLRTNRYKLTIGKLISPSIKFKTTQLQDLLKLISNKVITVGSTDDNDKLKYQFVFSNTVYNIALGGLHSVDYGNIFNCEDDNYIYRDADVSSYYPNGILRFDVYPNHLDKRVFRAVVGYTTDTRIESKHEAKKLFKEAKEYINTDKEKYEELYKEYKRYDTKAAGLKISINRMYGAFRDVNDFLYDPKCTYTVTINLQLTLLMLIEALELEGIRVISANTDGIVSKFTKEQEDTYLRICKEWEINNNFELEFTDYEKYIRRDVNNYIAIKKGFKKAFSEIKEYTLENIKEVEDAYIKRKGIFIENVEFNKGYNSPVIALALNQYFIYGKDYKETILNHINTSKDAIYDYCISQKTDKKFELYYQYVDNGLIKETKLQKSNRFYICEPSYGSGTLIKKEPGKNRSNRIVAKFSVKPFNDYIEEDNYHIDFSYYFRECSKVILGKTKAKKEKDIGVVNLQGSLFDKSPNKINISDKELELDINKEEEIEDLSYSSSNIVENNNVIKNDIEEENIPNYEGIFNDSLYESDDDLPF